ncbi:MAG TPA: hypothetical protein VGC22_05270, partial [Chitinophaga sp.]
SGGIAGDALQLQQPANNKLSWERIATLNLGIDFTILQERISGNVDVYNRTTTDMLGLIPLNNFSGFTTAEGNIGKYNNKGIEWAIASRNITGRNFTWSTRWVFSYNHNKLEHFERLTGYSATGSYKISGIPYYPGYPGNSLFAYRWAGLDNMGDPQIRLADKSITKDPFYQSRPEDVVYMGTTQPRFSGGLTNIFAFKGFSLTPNIIYNLGHVMRRDVNNFYTGRMGGYGFGDGNLYTYFLDRWKQPGDEARTNVPSYVADQGVNYSRRKTDYYRLADINVVSASYVKLRDITLAYDFQPGALRSLHVQRLNVYAQVTNFMIWKANHDGIDPEYHALANGFRSLPPFKHSYSLGLSFNF